MYGLYARECLLLHWLMPPLMPRSTNSNMSISVTSSSSTSVYLSIAPQVRLEGCVVVCRVQIVGFEAILSEIFKDVGKEEHICFQIEVGVVAESLNIEFPPNFLCVTVTEGKMFLECFPNVFECFQMFQNF